MDTTTERKTMPEDIQQSLKIVATHLRELADYVESKDINASLLATVSQCLAIHSNTVTNYSKILEIHYGLN